jgi:hypothetical protein
MKLNESNSANTSKTAAKKLRIAILLPRFNDELGSELLANTENQLATLGVEKVDIYRVPGALELSFAAHSRSPGPKNTTPSSPSVSLSAERPSTSTSSLKSHTEAS